MIAAGFGDRRKHGGSRLTHFSAKVLRFDLIFLDRDFGEWVAEIAEVLPEHAAVVDWIFEAHPIEEDVSVVGVESSRLKLHGAAGVGEGDARSDRCEAQEVARV